MKSRNFDMSSGCPRVQDLSTEAIFPMVTVRDPIGPVAGRCRRGIIASRTERLDIDASRKLKIPS